MNKDFPTPELFSYYANVFFSNGFFQTHDLLPAFLKLQIFPQYTHTSHITHVIKPKHVRKLHFTLSCHLKKNPLENLALRTHSLSHQGKKKQQPGCQRQQECSFKLVFV